MNLISGTYYSCERREYTFMVLREYTIISCKKIYPPSSLISQTLTICHIILKTWNCYYLVRLLFIYLFIYFEKKILYNDIMQ